MFHPFQKRWACAVLLMALTVSGFGEFWSSQLYCAKEHALVAAAAGEPSKNYAPSREVDILNQLIDVTPDFEQRRISGRVQIDFRPIARPLEELKLDAVDLQITSVEASVALLGWQNTGAELIVTFAESIPAGQDAWVRIVYSANAPQKGLYFRTPDMGYKESDTHLWTQGEMHEARHWFPSYDYPNEKFTSEMICHVPDDMVALSNGKLVSKDKDPNTGLVAWRWNQDKPHVNYLITLCAGKFQKIEDNSGSVPMAFWAPPSQINTASNSFAGTHDMLEFFETEIGVPYPWARYDQVVVDDFNWGGMENTAQTTLTDGTLFPDELAGTRSSSGLVAHELAHQWFGDLLTTKDWSHVWLNEGFATYYDALYHEHAKGRDEFLYEMLGNARSVLGQSNDILPIVYRGYEDPVEQFGYRAYPKGSWILHMLRSQLGPELYRQVIKTYVERHAYGNVTTADLIRVVEELSGRDWDQFFDQYVFHAHHPELKVACSWDERTKLAKLSIDQKQKLGDTVLLFNVPVPVRFRVGTNMFDFVAQVSRSSEDFYFSLPGKPQVVRVDPDYTLLAEVEFSPPDEMLYAQLADLNDMMGRIVAVEALSKKKDQTTIQKLQQVLNNDPFWGVRVEAAKALREMAVAESREALLASVDQPNDKVRREVYRGIAANFDPATRVALAEFVATEPNPDLKADAIRALAAYPVEDVRPIVLEQLASDSYKQILAGAALDAARSQQSPVYLDAVLKTLTEREADFTTGGFNGGMNTLARLAAEIDDKTPYREFLLAQVNHRNTKKQLAAVRALGELGDPLALAALETFTRADPASDVHKAASESIRKIRERRPQGAEVDTLRKEVLELQQSNRELKKEFEELKKKLDAAAESTNSAAVTPEKKKRGWFGGGN